MKKTLRTTFAVLVNATALGGMIYAGITAPTPAAAQNQAVNAVLEEYQEEQLECLALNIYFETHARSLVDAMSVTDVVLNRVETRRYPNTPCDVVHQGYKKGSRACQFSWYCDGKHDTPYDDDNWEKSRKYARDMYIHDQYRGITQGATHYHAHWMKAYWAPAMHRIARIGQHVFYFED